MIKVSGNEFRASGNLMEIMAEFTVLVRGLTECSKNITRKDIDRAVALAFMSDEELNKESKKAVSEFFDKVLREIKDEPDIMASLLKDIFGKE